MLKYDYSALRGKIREKYNTEKEFIIALNKAGVKICSAAFSNKINGKVEFKQTEIYGMAQLLNIALEDVKLYFFKEKYELNSYRFRRRYKPKYKVKYIERGDVMKIVNKK